VKLLIVEDEVPTASYLRRGLIEEGFAVDVAANAPEADGEVAVNDYDVIVLDVMLPGGDGFTLCRRWRDGGLTTPILFLTARDEVSDRVHGLEMGGDDYLVKPFAFEELLARVRALVRRAHGMPAASLLRIGDLVIDTGRRQVRRQERIVPLTAREYQILEYLGFRAGQLVTRTSLWEHVWESGREPDSNVVDVYVRYLRNKLGRDPDLIETVRGMGYVLQEGSNAQQTE
jgi:two-component system copper resistance phosphate regulon response regulator CusR